MNRALIIDTETTGLVDNHTLKLDKQPEIIEFCGVLMNLDTGEKEAELWHLFKPMRKLDKEITDITGLTDADLSKHKAFSSHADQIKNCLENAPVIVGHNLSFDMEMLDLEFERIRQKVKWPRCICTVEQTIHLKGHRLSMAALYELLFSETFADAHRAKKDVEALTRCVVELRDKGLL